MAFQKYVYTVVNINTKTGLGCFPNFKQAYERIEELADGNIVVDNGSIADNAFVFDVVRAKNARNCSYVLKSYVVYMSLLTVFSDRDTVSYEMVQELKEDERKRKHNATYRLKGEVM